jgi:acyl-CoA synthetase (AMP-forming)/AMP-acid ligase II
MFEVGNAGAALFAGEARNVAVMGFGRKALRYGGLSDQVARCVDQLKGWGVTSVTRVAIASSNGPELAVFFLAVVSHAIAVPLNPGLTENEYRDQLETLAIDVVVIEDGLSCFLRDAVRHLKVPMLRLSADPDTAGVFDLAWDGDERMPREGDVGSLSGLALLLQTSGTTSRPKTVPLTRPQLVASTEAIARTLALTEADRCLCIMPLFHIHGLVASVLAPLAVGGSIFCAPGFNALSFLDWLTTSQATWYTAVPSMHQAILTRAERRSALARGANLRFIRSSSAPLPKPVAERMEALFDAPVIESYGMTEGAHQISSNALPPGERTFGTVGRAAGPEVAVLTENGEVQAWGEGEILICGESVIDGYLATPEVNAEAFVEGWLRTGDLGRIDLQGVIRLTGRRKEMINRGGEKVSPLEVDGVLQEHPDIAQVLTFALPHPLLGEEVVAAVVLEVGAVKDEAALICHARKTLASFKVPKRILFLSEIPKGPTGKPQRLGLAERLGLVE